MSQVEQAARLFNDGSGFNCSQSVLTAYSEQYRVDRETALRIATAFGSGMARMGDTCGAVTGAMMVIGLKYGRTRVEDLEIREKAYGMVLEFVRRFTARNGSIMCRDLLGCELGTPVGQALAKEKGLHKIVCPKLVRDAAEILEEIL